MDESFFSDPAWRLGDPDQLYDRSDVPPFRYGSLGIFQSFNKGIFVQCFYDIYNIFDHIFVQTPCVCSCDH